MIAGVRIGWLRMVVLVALLPSDAIVRSDGPSNLGAQPPSSLPKPALYYDFGACATDIARLCGALQTFTDYTLLQCLHDAGSRDDVISAACKQLVWQIKLNATTDSQFAAAAKQYCSSEMQRFPDCTPVSGTDVSSRAHLLNCMLDHRDNIVDEQCLSFLNQIEVFLFTDFRLVGRFVLACRDDVIKYGCGKLTDYRAMEEGKHSQGSTLQCLMNKYLERPQQRDVIKDECRHEMLRIAELQSNDFHLDRPLFFACRDDRERFCRDVRAGDGRVIQCLMEHRNEAAMSKQCFDVLLQREKILAADFKASYPLVASCKSEIDEYKCYTESNDHPEYIFLSYVLLCLENAVHNGARVNLQCVNQMLVHRKLLMSDYRLEPELVTQCSTDIKTFCQSVIGEPQKVLHCLMGVAQTDLRRMQPGCYQAVSQALQVADVSTNYMVDTVLYNDCKKVIEGTCRAQVSSEAQMLSCLMSNIDSPDLGADCESRLLEVQFFLARNFALDSQLYDACHKDATEKCHARQNWNEKVTTKDGQPVSGADAGQLVLTCLYWLAYAEDGKDHLSPKCLSQVRRVMRERAISVRLVPEVADACLMDLSEKCSQRTGVGEELACLQENYANLEPDCQEAVGRFTIFQSRDFRLNQALAKACKNVLKTYCHGFAVEELDNGDVLECLIDHKGSPEMSHRCKAYVSHMELVSMKDYRFTFKFRQACRSDVEQHCLSKTGNDKASIVRCLSSIMITHILLGQGPELKKECRKQLRSEYFKIEMTDQLLDPDMTRYCQADLSKHGCYVHTITVQQQECLKAHKDDLEPLCRKYIFRSEKLQFNDNTFDVALQRVCSHEIQSFCGGVDKEHALHCLKQYKDDPGVSTGCAQLIARRQHEQAADVRLMPTLYTACSKEIQELCHHEFSLVKDLSDEDAKGVVLSCLRRWISQSSKVAVSDDCAREVRQIIFSTEIDPTLDVPFYTSCKSEINRLCSDRYLVNKGGHRGILECMKARYTENRIIDANCKSELVRIMKEELADIHLDVMLYQACVLDIKHYCSDVSPGGSKVLSCLLSAGQSSNVQLSDECRAKLTDRKLLWGKANREHKDVGPPENVVEFAHFVADSPARFSILSFLLGMVVVVFILGLCCGRVSRRKLAMKNR